MSIKLGEIFKDLINKGNNKIEREFNNEEVVNGKEINDRDFIDDTLSVYGTKFLKKYENNSGFKLSDELFMSMLSLDDVTSEYIDAMYNSDWSKDETNTPIGKLYTAYKEINTRCSSARWAKATIGDKLKTKFKSKKVSDIEFVDVDRLFISQLSDRNTLVRMTYKLYYEGGEPVENGASYRGLFLYFKMNKSHAFVNQHNKNVSFKFKEGYVPVGNINMDKKYVVIYNADHDDFRRVELLLQFTDFQAQKETAIDVEGGEFDVCRMYDELMQVYDSWLEARNKKIDYIYK